MATKRKTSTRKKSNKDSKKKTKEPNLKEQSKTVLELAGMVDPGEGFDVEKAIRNMEKEYGR